MKFICDICGCTWAYVATMRRHKKAPVKRTCPDCRG